MSFSKDDILKALRQGASIDQLAAEITNNLNAANEAYEKEQAAAEAERKRKAAEEQAKREAELNESLRNSDIAQIAVLLNKYIVKYHNNFGYPKETEVFRASDLRAMFNSLETFSAAVHAVQPEVKKAKSSLEEFTGDFSAAIDDFLDKFVR